VSSPVLLCMIPVEIVVSRVRMDSVVVVLLK